VLGLDLIDEIDLHIAPILLGREHRHLDQREAITVPVARATAGTVARWFRLRSQCMGPADQESSYRAIESLIATYAELVDDGDFAAVGLLLADATFAGSAGAVSGRDAIEKMLRDNVIVYDDGTPRTKHVTTNLAIEVDEEGGKAVSRSYFTVLQALPDLALQPLVSGRYHDRFERRDGRWRFVERRVRTDLVGDVTRHLRRSPSDP
jgi:3-phenylpropionate/cinnamic acid dioxygenase small subunit